MDRDRYSHCLEQSLRVALFSGMAAVLVGCGMGQDSDQQGGGDQPPPAVTVVTVEPESVEVEAEYAGRVRGSREVEVRARVEGILEERLYNEGQVVEEGQALFRIDPEPFEIALRSAEAERADAAASLELAERDWERISSLYESDAISRRERDQSFTNLRLAEARLAMANARVADAERSLRYTDVLAPVTGTTGLETFPEGSLIERGSLLTVVTQRDPAHVRFALPESDAAVQRLARQAMSRGNGEFEYEARVRLPDGSWYERTGAVDFTASSIDARTGTVSARAVFENPEGLLIPGQFVRVRVVLQELDDVFLVDATAVGQDSDGARLFVVDDDDVAHSTTVELGPRIGRRQVVLSGLESEDRVVVNGQVSVGDGARVSPSSADEEDD